MPTAEVQEFKQIGISIPEEYDHLAAKSFSLKPPVSPDNDLGSLGVLRLGQLVKLGISRSDNVYMCLWMCSTKQYPMSPRPCQSEPNSSLAGHLQPRGKGISLMGCQFMRV